MAPVTNATLFRASYPDLHIVLLDGRSLQAGTWSTRGRPEERSVALTEIQPSQRCCGRHLAR